MDIEKLKKEWFKANVFRGRISEIINLKYKIQNGKN